jgi:exportin-2 (importin alpha re-exporter)
LNQIWFVLFNRAKKSLTDSFSQELLSFLGFFAFIHGGDTLVSSIEAVQPGMFGMVFEKIWLAKMENVISPVAKKSVSLGLMSLLFPSGVLLKDQYKGFVVPAVMSLLNIVEEKGAAELGVGSSGDALLVMEQGGFSNVFSKLKYSSVKIDSRMKELDVRVRLQECVDHMRSSNVGVLEYLHQQLPSEYSQLFSLYLTQ